MKEFVARFVQIVLLVNSEHMANPNDTTISKQYLQVLHQMSHKYGPIFTVYLGGRRTVMLSDHNIIKDAFVKHSNNFIDRPQDLFFITEITRGFGKSHCYPQSHQLSV